MELQFHVLSKKQLLSLAIFSAVVSFIWFIYIFGILGHVCPVTFLGTWHSALLFGVALNRKRPSFLACFVSLITTVVYFLLAFFVFHPFDESNLAVHINPEPFIILILSLLTAIIIQRIFPAKIEKESIKLELGLEKLLAFCFGFIVSLIVGAAFLFTPWPKDMLWNNRPQDWYDTVFGVGDVYRLFLVLACIMFATSIMMGLSYYFQIKGDKNKETFFHLLGYTFWGFLFLGTWGTFVYLGKKNDDKSEKIK